MTPEEMQKFNSGFNEGVMYAVQLMASEAIRIINTQSCVLNSERMQIRGRIKMNAKRILQHRGLVPFDYDVMTGKAENVVLDFNMKY